jgi:hypothetical protein
VDHDEMSVDALALVSLELEPRERVIWSGRPSSVWRVVMQSMPKAMIGFISIIFLALWIVMVIHGGHNNWDRGQVVPPFARHNVLIATVAGLWIAPSFLYLSLSPIRAWRKLMRSFYVLTDRRALIVAPNFWGRTRVQSFTADALRLMRLEEGADGTGDMVFGNPSRWSGMTEPIGFLGIEKASDVEAIMKQALFTGQPAGAHSAVLSAGVPTPAGAGRKYYRLSYFVQIFQLISLFAGSLVAVCILADVLLVAVILIIGPERLFGLRPRGLKPIDPGKLVAMGAAGLGSLIMGAMVGAMFLHFALRIPFEITIDEDQCIRFRARMRTVTIPVKDLLIIQTGRWFDPNRFQVDVVHKSGKLMIINQFSDFGAFLATVKEMNPSMKIKGF